MPDFIMSLSDTSAGLSQVGGKGASLARELGIPAVVGCGNATMLLKTSDRVRVDGSAGSVEVLKGID